MVVAGEASGDKHGAALARSLKQLYPETLFDFFGAGGEEMRLAGVETLVDAKDVAIIGIPEIIGALGKFYSAYKKLIAAANERKPDAVVLIDWPDFNMRVAKKLRKQGFKIIYYISPQVWAWRRYRVKALRRDVDKMLVILPFEEEFYRAENIDVEYIGHPLANAVHLTTTRAAFAAQYQLDATRLWIALLPGSRHKEIHYHLPAMLDAAARLQNADCGVRSADSPSLQNDKSPIAKEQATETLKDSESPHSALRTPQSENPHSAIRTPQFILPLASTISRQQVEATIEASGVNVKIIERDTYNAMGVADFAIVASGTATVETALADTPMVIVYRGSEVNWRLIRPLIHLDTFGMVNLIAGRRIVPELMQHDVTGEKIAAEVKAILNNQERLKKMREDLREVQLKLKAGGANGAERAAQAVMRVIQNS
ncbi:MAG: lipid-A-disaccharide synthase [Acidobacteria bacterium]|nr:lipid-A-disaccharide synthase [Acidobacteriota bacterium]